MELLQDNIHLEAEIARKMAPEMVLVEQSWCWLQKNYYSRRMLREESAQRVQLSTALAVVQGAVDTRQQMSVHN